MMTKKWEIDVNGKTHTIEAKPATFFNNTIIVDGKTTIVKSNNIVINAFDYEFNIEDTVCHITGFNKKLKLAVNGTYIDTNEQYVPVGNIPIWVHILTFVSIFGGLFFIGLLGALIGCGMGTLYIIFSLKKKYGGVIASFVLCTIIQFVSSILILKSLFS